MQRDTERLREMAVLNQSTVLSEAPVCRGKLRDLRMSGGKKARGVGRSAWRRKCVWGCALKRRKGRRRANRRNGEIKKETNGGEGRGHLADALVAGEEL